MKDFIFIAGPCVIENYRLTLYVAKKIKEVSDRYGINIVFKSSYDKANRTSISGFRGPGLDKGGRGR